MIICIHCRPIYGPIEILITFVTYITYGANYHDYDYACTPVLLRNCYSLLDLNCSWFRFRPNFNLESLCR